MLLWDLSKKNYLTQHHQDVHLQSELHIQYENKLNVLFYDSQGYKLTHKYLHNKEV